MIIFLNWSENLSKTAWDRIMIFSLQIASNVYMTWLTFGKILYLTELSPFSDFGILRCKASLWTKYLENRLSFLNFGNLYSKAT